MSVERFLPALHRWRNDADIPEEMFQ